MTWRGEYEDGELTYIDAIRIVSCLLSLCGAAFILLTYLFFKDARTFGRRILVYMSIADGGLAISFLLPSLESYRWCKAQSVLSAWWGTAAVLWCLCLAHYIVTAIRTGLTGPKHELRYHMFVWTFALLSALAVALVRVGYSRPWCWIPRQGESSDETLRFTTYYLLLWVVLVVLFVSYLYVYYKLRDVPVVLHASRAQRASVGSQSAMQLKKLVVFPLVLFLIHIPGSFNRTGEFLNDADWSPPDWMVALQAWGDASQGFWDGVMFGLMNERVRKRFFHALRTCSLAPWSGDDDEDEWFSDDSETESINMTGGTGGRDERTSSWGSGTTGTPRSPDVRLDWATPGGTEDLEQLLRATEFSIGREERQNPLLRGQLTPQT